jgi:hypothetical protein
MRWASVVLVAVLVAQSLSSEASDDLSPVELGSDAPPVLTAGAKTPAVAKPAVAKAQVATAVAPVKPAVATAVAPVVPAGEQKVPLSTISSFASQLQAANQKLAAQNKALRVEREVEKARQKILVVGGKIKLKKKKKALKKAAKIPPKQEMQPVISKGIAVMSSFETTNKKLEAKLEAATAKIGAIKQDEIKKVAKQKKKLAKLKAKANVVRCKYHRVPFFKFAAAAKTVTKLTNRKQCQDVCDRQTKCKSFSWSEKSQTCLWSVDAVRYDPNYSFHVKAQVSTDGDPHASWRGFRGLKFLSATGKSKTKEKTAFPACKRICDKDANCKSFSYRQDTKFCSWSNAGVEYTSDFNYFEKSAADVKRIADKIKAQKVAAQAAFRASEKLLKKKEKMQADKAKKENDGKKKKKERWVKNMPTRTAAKKLKSKVKLQVQNEGAKLSAEQAAADTKKKALAEKNLEAVQLATLKKVKGLESSLRKLKEEAAVDKKRVGPVEKKESEAKASVLKLKTKLKVAALAQKAKEALKSKSKKSDDKTKPPLSKKAVALKKLLGAEEAKQQKDDAKLNAAKGSEATTSAAVTTKEAKLKADLKAEKTNLRKQKLDFAREAYTAGTARMVAMTAKEKVAKTGRANAKKMKFTLEQDIKLVKDESGRLKIQRRLGNANAELFKKSSEEKSLLESMKKTAYRTQMLKEILFKSKAKIKAKEKANAKRAVKNQLAQLMSGTKLAGAGAKVKPVKAALPKSVAAALKPQVPV